MAGQKVPEWLEESDHARSSVLAGATAAESLRRALGFAVFGLGAAALGIVIGVRIQPLPTWADYAAFALMIGASMGFGGALYLTVLGCLQHVRERRGQGTHTGGA